jgi:hypothetical protein
MSAPKYTVPQARKDARRAMEEMDAEYQNTDGIPDRFEARLKALHQLGKDEVGFLLSDQVRRLIASYQVYLLAAWGRGDIEGKLTEQSISAKANRTESLAKMLEAKGNDKAAKAQRKKAAELRTQALTFRGQS